MTQTIEQLQAKVAELEKELLKTKLDLLTSYGESEELLGRIAELEAEVERLKRTNSSYANLTKAQESQLTNLRQRLYQLKGADSAIDSERQANCELTEQLAAEQLNNKRLREALEAVIKVHGYESGIPVEALSTQASTKELDAYVKQKIKEYY